MVDISIAVLLGIITLATAYLGVHVTLHPAQKPRQKIAFKIGFIACGLVACILIGVQTYRNNSAQEQLRSQINRIHNDTVRIERNTEQPPKVQVTNNIPPPSVILQGRLPNHGEPIAPDERLKAMTNRQLKKETLRIAKTMRGFEKNLLEQAASYSPTQVTRNGRAPESDETKRIYADSITVYNNTMLHEAVALRAELWRRVGGVSPDRDSSLEAFAPLPIEIDHIDFDRHPITDAARYLETLAMRLK